MEEYIKVLLKDISLNNEPLRILLYNLSTKKLDEPIELLLSYSEKLSKCGNCMTSSELIRSIKIQFEVVDFLRAVQQQNRLFSH